MATRKAKEPPAYPGASNERGAAPGLGESHTGAGRGAVAKARGLKRKPLASMKQKPASLSPTPHAYPGAVSPQSQPHG